MTWQDLALEHAQKEFPRESCGLLVINQGKESYLPCKNLAVNIGAQFMLDPEDWAKAEDTYDEILGVVHSHPYSSPQPSNADLASCEKTGIPWHIVSTKTGHWHSFSPSNYQAPLNGRIWAWKYQDCWSLCRDYYMRKGIVIRDFERPDNPKDFQSNPFFDSSWKECGFRELEAEEELKPDDFLLLRIMSKGLNHCAVYLGEQRILHHLSFKLSTTDLYGEFLLKCTGRRLRHAQND